MGFKGVLIDLGMSAGQAIIDGAKSYFSPLSPLSIVGSLASAFGSKKPTGNREVSFEPDPEDPLSHRDRGYLLAQHLLDLMQKLHALITYHHSPPEDYGVDWDGLSGRSKVPDRDIRYFLNGFADLDNQFRKESSGITKLARNAAKPAIKVSIPRPHVASDQRQT